MFFIVVGAKFSLEELVHFLSPTLSGAVAGVSLGLAESLSFLS
jgi:hypothetical protein